MHCMFLIVMLLFCMMFMLIFFVVKIRPENKLFVKRIEFQMNTLYHCLLSMLFVAFLAKLELCASVASNLCETLLCLQEGSNASVVIRCRDHKNAKGCSMLA